MANFMKFNTVGTVIGKEYKKAITAFTTADGRTISEQPERYFIYIAIGERWGNTQLFDGSPVVLRVFVDSKHYENVKGFGNVALKVSYNTYTPSRSTVEECSELGIGG